MQSPRFPNKREAWEALLRASCIDSHDYDRADAAYATYCDAQAKRGQSNVPKPPSWEGGELDAVNEHIGLAGKRRVSGAREAFDKLTPRNVRLWADLFSAIAVLRRVPGLERLRMPDEVTATLLDCVTYWRGIEYEIAGAVVEIDDLPMAAPDCDGCEYRRAVVAMLHCTKKADAEENGDGEEAPF